jgi:hypothetical protein
MLWLAAVLPTQAAAASPDDIGITKAFSPSSIGTNGTSTLTLVLTNPANSARPNIGVVDNYPAGMVNATPLTITSTCSGTATAAGSAVILSAAKLDANTTCTVTILVTASTPGMYSNTTEPITASNGGGATANAILTVIPYPSLVFLKSVAVHSDPVNGTSAPKNIPGAEVDYMVKVTNTGAGAVDSGSLTIVDPVPANTELFTGDLGGGAPFVFADGALPSAISCNFTALDDPSDCVDFSANGADWTYVPNGSFDPAVTHIRFRPTGSMVGDGAPGAPSPSFDLRFRVRVK